MHQPILDAVTQLAVRHPTIDLVYLFGSQVEGGFGGNVGPMSDYDFAVLLVPS